MWKALNHAPLHGGDPFNCKISSTTLRSLFDVVATFLNLDFPSHFARRDTPESRNELSVSPDGNTAVVKIVKTGDALVGVRVGDHAYDAMAKVETVEEVTLDITGDNPRVIAVRLGQKVAP